MHGDEPMEGTGCTVVGESAPVRTGMNLIRGDCMHSSTDLPRIHEDEPWHAQIVDNTTQRSAPYVRGCISQIANPIIPQDDLPHIHGDEPHRTRPD